MSTIHHLSDTESGELRWQGVPVRAYGSENSGADRATRQVLIGIDENSPNYTIMAFMSCTGVRGCASVTTNTNSTAEMWSTSLATRSTGSLP